MSWLQRALGRGLTDASSAGPADDEDLEDVEALMDMAVAAAASGDFATAVAVWRPLAEQGWPPAQASFGACLAEGLGTPRDLHAAADWFSRAARSGDAIGQRRLATLIYRGEGGAAQDDVAAAELYRLAAEQGDAAAQDMLSWMLLAGEGADPDPLEARRWALAAAEQGVAGGMTRLGLMARDGIGMEPDAEEAARWWYEAARRGDADGQAMLGAALHDGVGVEKDDRAALIWLLRGEAGGSALATSCVDAVRGALSTKDAAAAEEAARRPILSGDDA
jgi:TPR repeat protein